MEILERLIIHTERKMQQARDAHPGDDRCRGSFTFGNCIVTFSMSKRHKDIEVWNPVRDTYLECIAEHIKDVTPHFSDLKVEETDEWDNHGFRDESDYNNYRYG